MHKLLDYCDPNPCLNGGDCTNGGNFFTCHCVDGFTGESCETDIDDCDSNPCNNGGNCTDGINSFTCDCVDGTTGVICEICKPLLLYLLHLRCISIHVILCMLHL